MSPPNSKGKVCVPTIVLTVRKSHFCEKQKKREAGTLGFVFPPNSKCSVSVPTTALTVMKSHFCVGHSYKKKQNRTERDRRDTCQKQWHETQGTKRRHAMSLVLCQKDKWSREQSVAPAPAFRQPANTRLPLGNQQTRACLWATSKHAPMWVGVVVAIG